MAAIKEKFVRPPQAGDRIIIVESRFVVTKAPDPKYLEAKNEDGTVEVFETSELKVLVEGIYLVTRQAKEKRGWLYAVKPENQPRPTSK